MSAAIQIKICGLTNVDDARCALEAGADCLGFVLAPRSPRYLAPEKLEALCGQLPAHACTVGVFVDAPLAEIRRIVLACRLDIVQLHGDEPLTEADALRAGGCRIWRSWRLQRPADVAAAERFPADAVLVDSSSAQARGGTGKLADWNLAAQLARQCRVMLAGGLTPQNVRAAIHRVRPFGVDVSSGVEASPGRKAHAKIREFVAAARAAAQAAADPDAAADRLEKEHEQL